MPALVGSWEQSRTLWGQLVTTLSGRRHTRPDGTATARHPILAPGAPRPPRRPGHRACRRRPARTLAWSAIPWSRCGGHGGRRGSSRPPRARALRPARPAPARRHRRHREVVSAPRPSVPGDARREDRERARRRGRSAPPSHFRRHSPHRPSRRSAGRTGDAELESPGALGAVASVVPPRWKARPRRANMSSVVPRSARSRMVSSNRVRHGQCRSSTRWSACRLR